MAKTLVTAMTSGVLALLCVGTPAYATPVTVDFYVRVDSVTPLDPAWQAGVPWDLPHAGERFYGWVTYDDANVPTSGTHTIGYVYPGMEHPPVAVELQGGALFLPSPIGVPIALWPSAFSSGVIITLVDSRFSGITCLDSVDTHSLDRQFYSGTAYGARGRYSHPVPARPELSVEEEWSVQGTLHVVPDPGSTLLLLSIGLLGLRAVSERRGQSS